MAAETWLCGSVASYYKYPGIPYLSFDGVDDRATVPIVINGDFSLSTTFKPISGKTGIRYLFRTGTDFSTGVVVWFDASAGTKTVKFQAGTGSTFEGVVSSNALVMDFDNTISISLVGRTHTITLNGVTTQYTRAAVPVFNAGSMCVFGKTSDNTVNVKADLSALTINGITYLNPGDQNAGGLLPSNPSGAGGTLIGGVSWMYNNIARHDETAALTLAAINATTLTGPLLVIDLDGAIPVGYLPTSKDGWGIIVSDLGRSGNNCSDRVNIGLGV